MAKKATILDVAKAAEVSTATVSRVLNNPQSVRKLTRMRVQKAFADTGYSSGALAGVEEAERKECAAAGRNRMLLMLVPDLRNPFYNDVLDGIRYVASLLNEREIAIHASCENTIKEFASYIWDAKASEKGEDKPVKQMDHCMDALRYMCYTIIRKPSGIHILK